MIAFVINVAVALGWSLLWGSGSPEVVFAGFLLGYGSLWLVRPLIPAGDQYFSTTLNTAVLAAYFMKELVKSCIDVARLALTPGLRLNPGIVRFPVGPIGEGEVTVLANLITLTPGTLTVDFDADAECLYVHCLHVEDESAIVEGLRTGMLRQVQKVFRP